MLQVSWLRSESLQIISVEYLVFTHDNRYSLSRSMELTIARVSHQDSGQYECQMVDKSLGSMTKHIVELRVETDKYRDSRLQHDDPQLLLGQCKNNILHIAWSVSPSTLQINHKSTQLENETLFLCLGSRC